MMYYYNYKLIQKTMSPTNMLELEKLVLENVCDNKVFFEKELRKSFSLLEYDDLSRLYHWALEEFKGNRYYNIVKCVFLEFDFHESDQIKHAV